MRSLLILLAVTLALLCTTTAWPWPRYLSKPTDMMLNAKGLLERRQNSGGQGSSGNSDDEDNEDGDDGSNNEDEEDGDDQEDDNGNEEDEDDNGNEEEDDDDNENEGDNDDQNDDNEVDEGEGDDDEDNPDDSNNEDNEDNEDDEDGDEDEDEDGDNEDDDEDGDNEDDEDDGDDDDDSNADSNADSNTDSNTDSDDESPEPTKTFDPRLPPGGVNMVTPAITTTEYYKIGDHVTFAWNYTSLSVTPSSVDILAECSSNQATYTLAQNVSVKPTNRLIWDTGDFQATATLELLTSYYTLIVYDASNEDGAEAVAKSGYLGVFNQFQFGMYKPQKKTEFDGNACTTCNGALSAHQRQTLGFLFGMAMLTVLSFGWFANGFLGGVVF